MAKLKFKLPNSILDLPTNQRLKIADELAKALGVSRATEPDENIWDADPHPARAQLENAMTSELISATYQTMLYVFEVLGLDTTALPQTLEKSLNSSTDLLQEWSLASGVPMEYIEKALRDTYGKFRPEPQRYAYTVQNPDNWGEGYPTGRTLGDIIYIPVNRLETPYQTERATNPETVSKKQKMMHDGTPMRPIIIGYDFDIHDGHHSWLAAKAEGHTHVPCIVGGTEPNKVKSAEDYYRQMFKAIATKRTIPTSVDMQLEASSIEQALQSEKDTYNDYISRIKDIADPLITNILEDIAAEESTHVNALRQILYYITGDAGQLRKSIATIAPPRLLYRGIGDKELEFIKKNGYIQSKGAQNNEDQEGLTSYATTREKAAKYTVDNVDLYGVPDAYVICIKRPQRATESPDTFEEATVSGKVPASDIVSIWKLDNTALEHDMDTFYSLFDRVDTLTKGFNPDEPRDEQGRWTMGSASFKAWFGNSKVVNANGTPRVLYHGTQATADFSEFHGGTEGYDPIDRLLGAHFAVDSKVASRFAEGIYRHNGNGRVYPVYAALQKPRVIDQSKNYTDQRSIEMDAAGMVFPKHADLFNKWAISRFGLEDNVLAQRMYETLKAGKPIAAPEFPSYMASKATDFAGYYGDMGGIFAGTLKQQFVNAYKDELAAQGYDGIQYSNTSFNEVKAGDDPTAYIVFDSRKVKSATGNAGTYDPSNPDITKSFSSEIEAEYPGGRWVTERGRHIYIKADGQPANEFISEGGFRHSDEHTQLGNQPIKYHNIQSESGHIKIMENSPYAQGMHSVYSFQVDEDKRGNGEGGKLLDEALQHYGADAMSAQVSSLPSLHAFYNRGFRPYDKEGNLRSDIDLQSTINVFENRGGSLCMVLPYSPARTPEFKKWFGKSKVVDDDRQPLKVYHGTTFEFTKYNPNGGNPENDLGIGFYATSSINDVNSNYSSYTGADLQNKILQRQERITEGLQEGNWEPEDVATELFPELAGRDDLKATFDDDTQSFHFKAKGFDKTMKLGRTAAELAKKEVAGQTPNIMPVYLKIENPLVLDKNGGTTFHIEQEYDEENDEYGDETGNGIELLDAIRDVAADYDMDGNAVVGKFLENCDLYGDDVTAFDVANELKAIDEISYVQDADSGQMMSGQVVQDIFRRLGYDGIIYKDAFNHFTGMQGLTHNTQHFIVFKPTQIKSATGNGGAFDPNDPDMTKGFNPDEPRDSDGKWTRVYHGSPTAGIKEFDMKYAGSNTGDKDAKHAIFFTDNPAVAESYMGEEDVPNEAGEKLLRELEPLEAEIDKLPFRDRRNHPQYKRYSDLLAAYTGDDVLLKPKYHKTERTGQVYPVDIQLEHPYVVDMQGAAYDRRKMSDFIRTAHINQNDGVIVKNTADPGNGRSLTPSTVYAVFSPEQTHIVQDDDLQKALWVENEHPRSKDGKFTTKWGRAAHIGMNIDNIRRKYNKDLKLKGMPRDKVTALMVGLIDKGCFRIGNDESAEERGVYGLTTLTHDHVTVDGDIMHFDFIGKKGVHQQHSVKDAALAKVMQEVLKIKGGMRSGGKEKADNAVFKFINTQGQVRTPSQYVINSYLDRWGVTAKDFRTYHATRLTFAELERMYSTKSTEAERKQHVQEAIELAAKKLGHQPKTCKRSYVDPRIVDLYVSGKDIRKSLMADVEEPEDYKPTDTNDMVWKDYSDMFWRWYGEPDLEKEEPDVFLKSIEPDLIKGENFDKFMGNVRKKFRDRLKYKANGKPFSPEQLSVLERICKKFHVNPSQFAESFMTRATVLGRLLGATEKEDRKVLQVVFDSLPIKIEATQKPVHLTARYIGDDKDTEVTLLPLQNQERNALEWAKMHAADYIQSKQQDLLTGVRRLVMQAKQERWEPNYLAGQLFDYFGSYNRDWRRIALTELAYAENNGYLMTLQAGDTVYIFEAANCCKKCKEINLGKTFTYVKKPGNPYTEVWVGKSNVGRKAADWVPVVPLHPHCRGRYMRLNKTFYKMDEYGKIILKTPEEIMAEKGITRRGR